MTTASPSSHARNAIEITPSDSVDIQKESIGLSVASSGVIQVTPELAADGSSIEITVVAGAIFPLAVKRVWATNLTAAGVVAHYRA